MPSVSPETCATGLIYTVRGLELTSLPSGLGLRHLLQSGVWKPGFQTCTEGASKGRFRRRFQGMHPSVDEFGTVRWPSRSVIAVLLD